MGRLTSKNVVDPCCHCRWRVEAAACAHVDRSMQLQKYTLSWRRINPGFHPTQSTQRKNRRCFGTRVLAAAASLASAAFVAYFPCVTWPHVCAVASQETCFSRSTDIRGRRAIPTSTSRSQQQQPNQLVTRTAVHLRVFFVTRELLIETRRSSSH